MTQATVGAWLKKEGDPVQADEPLVEVESEKATVALPAPAAGVLRRVLKRTGDSVAIGEVLGELEEGAAAQAQPPGRIGPGPGGVVPSAKGNGAAKAAGATRVDRDLDSDRRDRGRDPTAPAAPSESALGDRGSTGAPASARATRAPPSARRLMAEHGVAAEAVRGSGPAGQVRKEDVLRALEAPQPEAPRRPPRRPPRRRRPATARRRASGWCR